MTPYPHPQAVPAGGNGRPFPPAATPGPGRSAWTVVHAAVFGVLLLVWTVLLVKPNPVPESLIGDASLFFILSKAAHLSCYAFLAVLGGSLVPAGRRRDLVLALLVLHGAATEVGQWVGNEYYQTNRHGCVRDVLIDSAGIAAGAVVLWQAGRLRRRWKGRDSEGAIL